jgi:cysteine desulfurase
MQGIGGQNLTLRPRVRAAMQALLELGANPSSLHAAGRRARQVVEGCRAAVGRAIGRPGAEVVFVGSRAEAALLLVPGLRQDDRPAPRGPQRIGVGRGLWETCAAGIDALKAAGHALEPLELSTPAALAQRLRQGIHRLWLPLEGPGSVAALPAAALLALCKELAVPLAIDLPSRTHLPLLPAPLAAGSSLTGLARDWGGPQGLGIVVLQQAHTCEPLWGGGPQGQGLRPGTEAYILCAGLRAALEELEAAGPAEDLPR